MKYQIGDRVRIKSLDWYNENKNRYDNINCGYVPFTSNMSIYCEAVLTICDINEEFSYYRMEECEYAFTDEMIEGLVEEETKPKYEDEVNGEYETNGEFYSTPKYLVRPSGYQFVDENGNVINATKIVLEKKKKEYPKTYNECYRIMNIDTGFLVTSYDLDFWKGDLLTSLQKLLVCRDAYWKIAGAEMGLGEPWKPDWLDDDTKKYVITSTKAFETFGGLGYINYILAFPTKEMRDAFKENFGPDIEICKEFL